MELENEGVMKIDIVEKKKKAQKCQKCMEQLKCSKCKFFIH